MNNLLTFESIKIGEPIGTERLILSKELVEEWYRIYRPGQPAEQVTTGFLMAIMMRGYIKIVSPRPLGNIQSRHCITFQEKARIGDRIEITLACTAKSLQNDRRWVTFSGSMNKDLYPILKVEMDFLWAA